MVGVQKSSRHSKITGDFAEHLVLYWFSKHGIECARVDHVGLDLIARQAEQPKPMGISVKSRSRNPGTEGSYLSIPNDNFAKLRAACDDFGCEPYFAIMVDERDQILVYVLHADHLERLNPQRQRVSAWKMSPKWLEHYEADEGIIHFKFSHSTINWW